MVEDAQRGRLSGWHPLFVIVAVDALILATVIGLALASGGFDAAVVSGGLFIAVMVGAAMWFFVALKSTGYRSPARVYDTENYALQIDQYLQEPGQVRPRRAPKNLHAVMAGVVGSLTVLAFVFASV